MFKESIEREFYLKKPVYECLREEIIYILETKLKEQNISIHLVEGRIKEYQSFIDKVIRKDAKDPFNEITDICGVRIICLFLSDIAEIGNIVETEFIVHTKDDKIKQKQDDTFGYLSVHYICSLPDNYCGPRYNNIKNLKFEIQIRTIAMHAWSAISHYMDYKSPHAIPSKLKKDFNALSAMFYVIDSHFELFINASKQQRELAKQSAEEFSQLNKEEVNLETLKAYLIKKYPNRKHSEAESLSELTEELVSSGYTSFELIDKVLDKTFVAFCEYEKEYPPVGCKEYNDVGVVRISFSIADDNYILNTDVEMTDDLINEFRDFRSLVE